MLFICLASILPVPYLGRVIRKSAFCTFEIQRRRSAIWPAPLFSQPLFWNASFFEIQNFKTLTHAFCNYTAWFVSYLVGSPEDKSSPDEARVMLSLKVVLRLLQTENI